MVEQRPLGRVHGQRARHRERLDKRRGDKMRCDIQQRAGVADRLVAFAVQQHAAALPHGGRKHGEDALGRAAGQKKAVVHAEIARRGDLGVADRPVAQVQVARAVGFGEIDGEYLRIAVEQRLALMPRHMEARGIAGRKQLERVEQRRARERHQPVDLAVGELRRPGSFFVMEHGPRPPFSGMPTLLVFCYYSMRAGRLANPSAHALSIMCRHSSFSDGFLGYIPVVNIFPLYYNEYCVLFWNSMLKFERQVTIHYG